MKMSIYIKQLIDSCLCLFFKLFRQKEKTRDFFFITCLLLLFLPQSYGQMIADIGGISVVTHQKTSLSSDLDGANKLQLSTYEAWLPLPPLTLGKTRIVGNLNYKQLAFHYTNATVDPLHPSSQVEEAKAVVYIQRAIGTNWSLFAVAMPTLASNHQLFDFEHFLIDGITGVSRTFGSQDNLTLGVGGHIQYAFGKTLITPAVAVDYHSVNEKWQAQFYWPRLNILYRIRPTTQIGLAGTIDWTRFRLDATKVQEGEGDYAQFSTVHLGLQFQQQLYKGIHLQVQGGLGVFTSYEVFDAQHKTLHKSTLSNLPYAKVMLSYRLGRK